MRFLKKLSLTLIIFFSCLYIWGKIYSIEPELVSTPPLADTARMRTDLYYLTKQCRFRNFQHSVELNKAAEYIRKEFAAITDSTWYQEYLLDSAHAINRSAYKNVICSMGPRDAERIIVGAHYDACLDQEGADDNASGVCGLLELARLLKNEKLKYRIDFVAYTNEEPPFFGTDEMGSYVHAKSLADSGIKVKGMICLEMIGYYSDEPGSQDYPLFFLKWFYGNKGDFITVAQKNFNGEFGRFVRKQMKKKQVIRTKSFTAPSWVGGISLSDHRNYWKFGYSAVMITNTAFFRNKNYHRSNDTAERLDVRRMALVTDELYNTILAIP